MKNITPEFQKELFKYILQNKSCARLIKDIHKDVFTYDEHKLFIILLKKYVDKYSRLPSSSITFTQFLYDNKNILKLEDSVMPSLEEEIESLYKPIKADEDFLGEHLVSLIQYQQIKNLFGKYAPILHDGSDVWDKMKMELEATINLGLTEEDERPIPTSILDDWYNDGSNDAYAFPTFLKALNQFTTKKGFAPPELIEILGLPKGFKTGTMLNIGAHYALDGLHVFVADFENGITQMRQRIKQVLLEAEYKELFDGTHTEHIQDYLHYFKMMGGSIWVGSYNAFMHTANDVKADMRAIMKDKDITFNCIVWDYADIMKPTIKQNRGDENISRVYHDIVSVHKTLECFGFTASHTKQSALGKFEPNMGDQSAAWSKNKDAHACFYITQDEDEEPYDLARIGVVFQRQGVKKGHFYVKTDIARQTLIEVPTEIYEDLLNSEDDI